MVSIIIPAYNYGKFITETLDSVINQSYSDFECIIIDNGSTDDTGLLIAPYLKDSRFRYYYQENRGVSNARNNALRLAKGKYIQFLDADDLIEIDKLKHSSLLLDLNPEIDLVYTDMRYFQTEQPLKHYFNYSCSEQNDLPWMPYVSGKSTQTLPVFLTGNIMPISAPLFRSSILSVTDLFDESLNYNEDWDLWMRMALSNIHMVFLDKEGTKSLIRIHKTSSSINVFGMQIGGLRVLLKNQSQILKFDCDALFYKRVNEHIMAIRSGLAECKFRIFFERIQVLKMNNLFGLVFKTKERNLLLLRLNLKLVHLASRIYARVFR